MKIQIRQGVFETNSSSVHSICILTNDEYRSYKEGDLFISDYGSVISKKDLQKEIDDTKLAKTKDYQDNSGLQKYYTSLEDYLDDVEFSIKCQYDNDEREIEHTARIINGQKVHALSIYSYDG